MCGIAGQVHFDEDPTALRLSVEKMTATMACRGPDAGGVWADHGVALGHRRLAVIDLPRGAQPMVAELGEHHVVVTYSGETYNFTELRSELSARGHHFRTRSDTEVVLRGYLEWGAAVAERLNGMFAFAIWVSRDQRLVLVRDRLGIKPLFYFPTSGGVLFGSEPKAIHAHDLAPPVVERDGLRELLTLTKTPGHAVYAGMAEVKAGTTVIVDRNGVREHTFWALRAEPHEDDVDTSVRHIRDLLEDIVALSGEGADEIFGGCRWFHDPEVQRADTFPWMSYARAHGPMGALNKEFAAALDLDAYVADRYHDAVAEAPVLPDDSPFERRMRIISYVHLTRMLRVHLDGKDRISMANGLEVRVPFCDHRLVQYVYNTPWSFKTFRRQGEEPVAGGGRRPAARGCAVAPQKPVPAHSDVSYVTCLQKLTAELRSQAASWVVDLFDRDAIEQAITAPAEQVSPQSRAVMERMSSFHAWNQICAPTIKL
ncbi:asparagine synthetase B [Kibdelosporangium aridum]|uniref:asparagine synthetase B family protein n=1 Tax=Kibdelosporangium aridum TaxID=2030 RepID=UPI00068D636E|nr:asparagine synthetase B [Kibdelosporangium aridum]